MKRVRGTARGARVALRKKGRQSSPGGPGTRAGTPPRTTRELALRTDSSGRVRT
jgi:hypothetical protein